MLFSIDNVNVCKYCIEQYYTQIMSLIGNLFTWWKKTKKLPMYYKFRGKELLIEGSQTRSVQSILDFGVSATTSCHNEKLLKSAIDQDVPLIYLADDNLESDIFLDYMAKSKKTGTQIGLEKIMTSDIEKVQHQTHGSLFIVPGISFHRYFELEDVKNKFLSILKALSMVRFSKPVFFVLAYSLNNFTPKEINRIHHKLKKIQEHGNIVLHVMNDYGEMMDYKESILGYDYSEYWLRNSGESFEMYPYFSNLHKHAIYSTLPMELKKEFTPNCPFLKQSHKYFKNGHVKKQGVVVFNKEKWFFEENHSFLLESDLRLKA